MQPLIDDSKLKIWQDEIKKHEHCLGQRGSHRLIETIIYQGILNNQWFTKWEDLDQISRRVCEWVYSFPFPLQRLGKRHKRTEYVLESLLKKFWYSRNYYNLY